MSIIEKKSFLNFGLLLILISVPIFLSSSFLIKSPFYNLGILSEMDISTALFLLAIIFLIVGIYFWSKTFKVKDE